MSFNFNRTDFYQNPYPSYDSHRNGPAIMYDKSSSRAYVFSYEDVHAFLHDGRLSSDSVTQKLQQAPWLLRKLIGSFTKTLQHTLFLIDAPKHTRLRDLVREFFLPKNMRIFTETAEKLSADALAAFQPGDVVDLKESYAYAFPARVICIMLGLPFEYAESLKDHSRQITYCVAGGAPSLWDYILANRSIKALEKIFAAAYKGDIKVSESGMTHHLIQSVHQGQLSYEEYLAFCLVLLIAGHETTTNQICNSVMALMKNREQWELLKRKPELIDNAVDELFRFDSSVQGVARVVMEDITHKGQSVKKGDVLYLLIGSANRDPLAFKDPTSVNIEREKKPHLSFGYGPHHCLGAFLAKMELRIALKHLMTRFPDMHLVDTEWQWQRTLGHRGPISIQVRL